MTSIDDVIRLLEAAKGSTKSSPKKKPAAKKTRKASAAQKSYQTGVKDVYGKGMTGALGNVAKQRGQAYSSIQDTISGWTQQAQRFKTGG